MRLWIILSVAECGNSASREFVYDDLFSLVGKKVSLGFHDLGLTIHEAKADSVLLSILYFDKAYAYLLSPSKEESFAKEGNAFRLELKMALLD